MIRLRPILAVLVAFALALAPIGSAWAATQLDAGMSTADNAAEMARAGMSDCMKAMQAQKPDRDPDCSCCNTPIKGTCADTAACLAKCGVHVVAILVTGAEKSVPARQSDLSVESQKPPDWIIAPPAPPPRS